MKVKFGMMMVAGSGKLGGQVASHNRGGAYVRTKSTPINPRTTYQQANRSLFASIAAAWNGLSNSERLSWNNSTQFWTKTDQFGDARQPSGRNLFIELNKNRFANYLGTPPAMLLVPPERVELPVINEITAEIQGNSFSAQWASAGLPTDPSTFNFIIRATPPLPVGRYFHKNALRKVAVVAGENDTYDLTADYIARFGSIPTSGNVFLEVQPIVLSTGQLGVPFSVQVFYIVPQPLITTSSIVPDNGEGPYVLSADFTNSEYIDGVNYGLQVRLAQDEGVCPVAGSGNNSPTSANELLEEGSVSFTTPVPVGSCRTVTISIVRLFDNFVVSSSSSTISNI